MPSPVTRPMRALTSWIAAISGQVNSMTHSMPWPNWAPTCE
jgi:hypothetical protein